MIETPLIPEFDAAVRAYAKLSKAGPDTPSPCAPPRLKTCPTPRLPVSGETFLNVSGADDVVHRISKPSRRCGDRAIAYRAPRQARRSLLSAGAVDGALDVGASGVLFTLDTELDSAMRCSSPAVMASANGRWAPSIRTSSVYKPTLRAGKQASLRRQRGAKQQRMVYSSKPGERVRIEETPAADRAKFCISDADVHELSKQALVIEQHYERPMDIEWAKDGITGKIYIVQARPETVKSRGRAAQIERYHLKARGEVLCEGRAIGQKIGAGTAKVIRSIKDMNRLQAGDVLVADMTDPDWEPIMKRASAIVTNRGGHCHAAIIARELACPVVGTGNGSNDSDGAEDVFAP